MPAYLLTPFLPYICVCRTDGTARVFTGNPLFFNSLITKHRFPGLLQAIGRKIVHAAGIPKRIEIEKKSLVISGYEPWDAFLTSQCFVLFAMPLGQLPAHCGPLFSGFGQFEQV